MGAVPVKSEINKRSNRFNCAQHSARKTAPTDLSICNTSVCLSVSVWCVWSLEHPHQSRSSNCCCCTRHPFAKQRQGIASIAKDPSHLDEQDLWVPLEKMSKLWRSASHDHFVHPPSSAFHRQESCKPKPVMNFEAHGYPGGLVRRSATHDQFMHPPSHMLRRRPPCKPKERIKFEDPEVPLPLSTHQTSFQNLGIPTKQLICRSKNAFKKETLRDVPGTYNPVSRTTSADAFLQKPLSTREPCMPPTNIASHYTSAEGWRFNQAGTAPSHFIGHRHHHRKGILPAGNNQFSTAVVLQRNG